MPKDFERRLRDLAALIWINSGEPEDDLVDMLTDLRLWAEYKGVNFYKALNKSYQHYLEQRKGPDKK